MAEMPLITVGLTCFQAADTICQAIQSAVAQDWPNLEIIIVDDCSTDGSAKIVEQAIAGIANARLIRHAVNGGPAAARNSLLAAAKGEFLIFFDDDDKAALIAFESNTTGCRLTSEIRGAIWSRATPRDCDATTTGTSCKWMPSAPAPIFQRVAKWLTTCFSMDARKVFSMVRALQRAP